MSKLGPDQVPEGWSRAAEGYEEAFTNITKKLSRDALELVGLGLVSDFRWFVILSESALADESKNL